MSVSDNLFSTDASDWASSFILNCSYRWTTRGFACVRTCPTHVIILNYIIVSIFCQCRCVSVCFALYTLSRYKLIGLGMSHTDTYNYTELCDFLKLLAISVSVSVSVLRSFVSIVHVCACVLQVWYLHDNTCDYIQLFNYSQIFIFVDVSVLLYVSVLVFHRLHSIMKTQNLEKIWEKKN